MNDKLSYIKYSKITENNVLIQQVSRTNESSLGFSLIQLLEVLHRPIHNDVQ